MAEQPFRKSSGQCAHIWRYYKLDENYQALEKCEKCGVVVYAEHSQ